ncbi:MAG TPA: methyltransferase domain-containing protein [Mucilaginibacter sp.]|jgi:hypothetical protein
MFRTAEVANVINKKDIKSLLDVGCRDCVLQKYLSPGINYFGNDLFQNKDNNVNYVGDINILKIDKKFDCVTAIDILEHTDDPYKIFDNLVALTNKILIINLPNCYGLKSVYKFSVKGQLGEKYDFGVENRLDRHRWLMNCKQICDFYYHKAKEHNLKLALLPIKYGGDKFSITSLIGNISRYLLPERLNTESVVGIFEKE